MEKYALIVGAGAVFAYRLMVRHKGEMPETFAKFFSIPENTGVMLGLDPSISLFEKKYQILWSSPSMTRYQ